MTEVTKRRAMALPTADAITGFSSHDFDALIISRPSKRARARPKIETLLMSFERSAHRRAHR